MIKKGFAFLSNDYSKLFIRFFILFLVENEKFHHQFGRYLTLPYRLDLEKGVRRVVFEILELILFKKNNRKYCYAWKS